MNMPAFGRLIMRFLLFRVVCSLRPAASDTQGRPCCAARSSRLGQRGSSASPTRSPMSYENIIVETRGKVGLVRLNRPQALNALNAALLGELGDAVDAFEADPAIGCIVIAGSDKAFAAGADIKEMATKSFMDAFMNDLAAGWDPVARARNTVVAAGGGFALGGRLRGADALGINHVGR